MSSSSMSDKFQAQLIVVNEKMSELNAAQNTLAQAIKKLQHINNNLLKKEQKLAAIPKKTRKPCGFALPVPVSNKMCDFLGVPYGTEVARTFITKEINAYIKTHNLLSPDNKKHIIPDETLSKLLMEDYPSPLTHFNLQKFINHHFSKKSSAVTAASTEA